MGGIIALLSSSNCSSPVLNLIGSCSKKYLTDIYPKDFETAFGELRLTNMSTKFAACRGSSICSSTSFLEEIDNVIAGH
jgi:hypothetical protein